MPEIVVYLAAQQLRQAMGLKKELQELLVANDDGAVKIDLDFCFFVVMGGFQVSVADEGIEPGPAFESHGYVPKPFVLRVSASGFLRLVMLGEIDLSNTLKATYIDDRSKTDVIQKALVLIQVSWMALQCIVRKVQGLPITLLEIHTMVHVVCALILYLFWIHKPLDISRPEMLDCESNTMRGFLALSIQSQLCKVTGAEFVFHPPDPAADRSNVSSQPVPPEMGSVESDDACEICRIASQREGLVERGALEASHSIYVSTSEILTPSGVAYIQSPNVKQKAPYRLRLAPSDVTRLERAAAFLKSVRKHNNSRSTDPIPLSQPDYEYCLAEHGNFNFGLEERYADLHELTVFAAPVLSFAFPPAFAESSRLGKLQTFLTPDSLTLAFPLVYGAIHLTAWESNFPTGVERYIRVFLTVESFISLRSLPIGAYAMPTWLQMMPHL
ncbi:hypothetical protein CPLU01_12852 [Colletotrichum plurivorum]|uniref:Uncharacterized protein n=1 Tax=Colletotrichum plurivorum TaxID=2175906 RepID=A0A8H6JW39_9PEZI|nr:hypothetical protein CPLU01_12852 [Colletotrichum plurivorum]